MIRSNHITIELACRRHEELVSSAAGVPRARGEDAQAELEHRDILAVVRGRDGGLGTAQTPAEPPARRPGSEIELRVRRVGQQRRFVRDDRHLMPRQGDAESTPRPRQRVR